AERTGLSIEAVQACGQLVSIPASPTYASLNLAQAIQVLAYCVRREALDVRSTSAPAVDAIAERLAERQAVAGLLAHAERALGAIGFLDPRHPKKLMPRLRRLATRARLRPEEVDLLRGICTLMERGAGPARDRPE
ncbi:MAG: TrmH family RNA methyltransferase, partial [Burkholderiaceae bacterium]